MILYCIVIDEYILNLEQLRDLEKNEYEGMLKADTGNL